MNAGSAFSLTRAALVATLTFGFAAAGSAQEIPEGQSCGGLVCDLGLFGHKVPPKPAPAPSNPVAVPSAAAPARSAAVAEPGGEARKPVRRKAHVAKATGTKGAGTKAASRAPGAEAAGLGLGSRTTERSTAPAVAAAPPAAPEPSVAVRPTAAEPVASAPVAAALALPPSFATVPAPTPLPTPAPVPVTATPARDEPVVLANPYVYDKPLKFMFQSVDPSQGAQ